MPHVFPCPCHLTLGILARLCNGAGSGLVHGDLSAQGGSDIAYAMGLHGRKFRIEATCEQARHFFHGPLMQHPMKAFGNDGAEELPLGGYENAHDRLRCKQGAFVSVKGGEGFAGCEEHFDGAQEALSVRRWIFNPDLACRGPQGIHAAGGKGGHMRANPFRNVRYVGETLLEGAEIEPGAACENG